VISSAANLRLASTSLSSAVAEIASGFIPSSTIISRRALLGPVCVSRHDARDAVGRLLAELARVALS
jgi:hypothetical protein